MTAIGLPPRLVGLRSNLDSRGEQLRIGRPKRNSSLVSGGTRMSYPALVGELSSTRRFLGASC